jgi:thiamine-monophosphate kinase
MSGEFEIIRKIRERARSNDDVRVGIGDDAAVLRHNNGTHLLVCSDLSIEGVHFRLDWTPPRLLGSKALAVTLSDIAAMGGVPRYALLSMALPHTVSSAFIDELLRGVFDTANRYKVALIGGDTSASTEALFLDTVAIGEVTRRQAITRGGAQANDIIFVTGSLGASVLGLKLLQLGHRLDEETDADDVFSLTEMRQQAIRSHLIVEPRLEFGQLLSERGLATAMIDVSDGLSSDLAHILEESDCGATLRVERIPVASSVTGLSIAGMAIDPLQLALHGGEEYELLFTAAAANRDDLLAIAQDTGVPITAIGRITDEPGLRMERNGMIEPLNPAGYEHKI